MFGADNAVAIGDPRLLNLSREELRRTGREGEFRVLSERPETGLLPGAAEKSCKRAP